MADQIKAVFSMYGKDRLDFTITDDIAQSDAFKDAVNSTSPFEFVVHIDSSFQFNVKGIQKWVFRPWR